MKTNSRELTPEQECSYQQIRYECLLRGVKISDRVTFDFKSDCFVCAIVDSPFLNPIFLSIGSMSHPDECVEVIVEFAKANRTYYKRAEMAQWN
jgi:hypothetical protein